nr:hypothetical protein BaRGS_015171 [Batillaria attramentaria]
MSSIYNGRKRRRSSKKARTGLLGFIIAVVKSDPGKYWLLKAIFAFPLGLLISLGLYITVVMPMDMEPENREFVGSASGLLLSLGAGRTYIAAFAIIFLVAGPIKNLIDNFREVARSLSCMAQLLANHTLTKWKLRLSPLKDAIEELQEEGFLIGQIGSVVEQAFAPLRREMEDQAEVDEMEQDIEEVEAIVAESQQNGPPPNPFSVKQIEEKHKLKPGEDEGEVVEDKWAKKLDLRCDDVFSRAILKCRDWFGDMEEKCMDALWLLGYILCLPLKMTFFCDLMRVISGALGMDCDSFDVVDPGVGGTYTATRDMVAEEIKAGVMNEYESKAQWVNFLLLICKRLLTFTFLLVFKEAYDYQKGFLTNFQHDNVYVTSYFRRIDARRKAAGKKKLLPLKRSEKQQMIFPTNRALMARETRDLKPGTAKLVFQAFVSVIIMYIDFLFVWVLNVIKRNSKIEYHQQGEQYVKIDVFGTGFMASIVRMFLTTFNSHHKLDSITSNEDCLPRVMFNI